MIYNKLYYENLEEIVDVIPNLEDLKNKNILIVGAGGLICSVLVDFLDYLNKKYQYCMKIYAADFNEEGCKKRFGDIIDNKTVYYMNYDVTDDFKSNIKFDYIIHGASPANPILYTTKPVETMLANILGTKNLLDYAKNNKVKKFIYISSSEIYGEKSNDKPYVEDDYGYVDILNSRACYPSSKRASETLCVSYYKEYNIETVIIRPGHVYGPSMTRSDTRAASQFAKDVLNGKDIVMKSEGRQLRSHCYVVDCISALLTVLLNGKSGEAYNISNVNSISTIREIAEAFSNVANKHIKFELPNDIEKKGYNLMKNSSLDSTKLENLNWKGKFDLKAGVEMTYRILQTNEK